MSTSTSTKRLPTSWRSWPESAKKKLRDELLLTSQEYTKRIDTLLALHTALTARVAALEFDALVATDGPTTEARNGGWISVKEGLPEDRDELYLTWADGEDIHRIAFPPRINCSDVNWWYHPAHEFCFVTHWQPLPDPPKP